MRNERSKLAETQTNGLILPGHLYPIQGNRYPAEPWVAQDPVEEMLRITYCDGLGLPPIDQIHLIYDVSRELRKSLGTSFVIAITRGAGMEAAGYGYYGTGYNTIRNDGMHQPHNIPVNDFDLFTLTSGAVDRGIVMTGIKNGMESGAQTMLKHPSLRYWTPYSIELSKLNVWEMPQYYKFNMKYFAKDDPITTLEIHHENLPDGNVEAFLNHYQPWRSNLVGSPIVLGLPEESGLKWNIWQPFPTETKWETGNHIVSLSVPDKFDNSPFCIPQATRFALFQLQASLVTDVPAEMDERTIDVMRNTISKHKDGLTDEQKAKAIKQLNTTLFLARQLEKSCKDFSGNDTYMNYALGDFKQFAAKTLDRIGWGDAVLGMSVTEYLEQMSENN